MHNLQIQVGELYRLKIGGGGTPFPRVPPYLPLAIARIMLSPVRPSVRWVDQWS